MKIYIDTDTGTWGTTLGLRILHVDRENELLMGMLENGPDEDRNQYGLQHGKELVDTALEQEAYIDKCIGALDDVLDWDEEVMGVRSPEGNWYQIAECISPLCSECDTFYAEMDEQQKAHHRVYRGMILVACEGYWMINPNALGLEGHENWMGRYETGDEG